MRHPVLRVVPEVLLVMCTDLLYKIYLDIDHSLTLEEFKITIVKFYEYPPIGQCDLMIQ